MKLQIRWVNDAGAALVQVEQTFSEANSNRVLAMMRAYYAPADVLQPTDKECVNNWSKQIIKRLNTEVNQYEASTGANAIVDEPPIET